MGFRLNAYLAGPISYSCKVGGYFACGSFNVFRGEETNDC